MTNAIVIYNSRGGNTKKIALKIAEGLEAECKDFKNIPDLSDYDLLVLGSWVIMGRIRFKGARYLRRLRRKKIDGKKVVLFFTSGAPDDIHPFTENKIPRKIHEIMFETMEKRINKKNQVTVLEDRFYCKGAVRSIGGLEEKGSFGHPTDEELAQAREFGEMLKEKLDE